MREDAQVDIAAIRLERGAHQPDSHYCVMELTSQLAGEPWTDHPDCASPAIATFLRCWNDALDDDTRQRLKPYAARVIGTNTGADDENRRGWMAADWLVRSYLPTWLDAVGLSEHAEGLRVVPEINTPALADRASDLVAAAETATDAAARDAARAAARAAVDAAAWTAARDAARAAVDAAAWAAARDAARAAPDAATAWDAAWAASWAAARDAAWAAAETAAGAAAGAAAREALAPTVRLCQESAFALLDRMIEVGQPEAKGG